MHTLCKIRVLTNIQRLQSSCFKVVTTSVLVAVTVLHDGTYTFDEGCTRHSVIFQTAKLQ